MIENNQGHHTGHQGYERLNQWRARGSDAGPHLKHYTKMLALFLNNTDILQTGSEIKHEIICMSHPYLF